MYTHTYIGQRTGKITKGPDSEKPNTDKSLCYKFQIYQEASLQLIVSVHKKQPTKPQRFQIYNLLSLKPQTK